MPAPKKNKNAVKEDKYDAILPAVVTHKEVIKDMKKVCKQRKIKRSEFIREAIQEKLERS